MLQVLNGGKNPVKLSRPLLLLMSEIPEIEQYLFHKLEAWKILFSDQLKDLESNLTTYCEEENVISINRDEFLSMSQSTRLKNLLYYLRKYSFLEEIVCERFFGLILPNVKNKLEEEDRKKINSI